MSRNREKINIPVRGRSRDVDVHEFIPIIKHPHMERLRNVSQLGGAALVWPDATHSRYVHSIGTGEETRLRLRQWPDLFPDEIVKLIRCFGFVHDIGHPPFSHPTETVLGYDHESGALEFIYEMKKELKQCGINVDDLKKFFTGEDPLSRIVNSHPFGTDKIDYTVRDARSTELTPPDVSYFDLRISWANDRLVVDNDHPSILRALDFRNFYFRAYGECYLHPKSAVMQRLIEKLWEFEVRSGRKLKEIARATDIDAIYWFTNSKDPECRRLAQFFNNRHFAQPVVIFRMINCARSEPSYAKKVKVYEASRERFQTWNKIFNTPQKISALEKELEKDLALPPNSIMIVPQFNLWRFDEKPIWTMWDGCIVSIDELHPTDAHHAMLLAQSYTAWRICVFEEKHRKKVYKNGGLIKERLLSI